MHEARMRQALKQLEAHMGQYDIRAIALHLLVACGYKTNEYNVARVMHKLTSHVALFAPILDSLDLD